MSWTDGVSPEQQSVIRDPIENVAVVAGPGTGKTRTLLHKALYLIEEKSVSPGLLRIVNFTNTGVRDLKKRVKAEPIYSAIDPDSITTFHSLALRFLRSTHDRSVPSPVVVLDDWEEKAFIDQLAKLKLQLQNIIRAEKMRNDYNSRWCIASEEVDSWLAMQDRGRYEAVYRLAKSLLGFTTRGELTYLWWRSLRASPGTTHADLGFPWTHLLVDEYQDLNECEHGILELLAKSGVRIFSVGDPNQSIYESMRHAHPQFCWTYAERVVPGVVRELNCSHRCPSELLRAAEAVRWTPLLGTSQGVPATSECSVSGQLRIVAFPTEGEEAQGFAAVAQRLLRQYPRCRILLAVPTRNIMTRFISEMSALDIPVDDRSARVPQLSEQCRMAQALLRLMRNPNDSVAAATAIVLNCGPSVRAERVGQLLEVADQEGKKVAELVSGTSSLPAPLRSAREKVRTVLLSLVQATNVSASVAELTGCGTPMEETAEANNGAEVEDIEQLSPGTVTLMTLNSSKGTEADWVLIPAMEPGFCECGLVGALETERRRLFYVGITRALSGVVLSYALRRSGPARYGDPTGPSRRKGASAFIDDICNRTERPIEPSQRFLSEFLVG